MVVIVPTLFDTLLSDSGSRNTVSKKDAENLFHYFQKHPLFNWADANNSCEGRADAICVLLDKWNIPNYKAWAFGGAYLKSHVGQLKQNWKYHVAALVSVEHNGEVIDYVIDPATGTSLKPVEEWAADITETPHSYYCIRHSQWYIFPAKRISVSEWNTRNKQNRKWMAQCLAGINSLTPAGRAKLIFNRKRVKEVTAAFEKLKTQKPPIV